MKVFLSIALACVLAACASTTTQGQTFYPYNITEHGALKPGAKLIIASHNFGKPSRKYLRLYEPRVDAIVRNHLEAAGYKIVSSRMFEQPYNDALRLYGAPYDEYTGKLNTKQLLTILGETFKQLKQTTDADAVVFTDIVELKVGVYRKNGKGYAEFDGVTRRVKKQGTGDITSSFDWGTPIDAATMSINVFALNDGQRIFSGRGGMDLTQSIDPKRDSFRKTRNLFKDEKFLKQGVDLAFHPMIKSDKYIEQSAQ